MSQFDHENILKIIGIVLLRNQPHIVMPMMKNKDLKSHISNRDNVGSQIISKDRQTKIKVNLLK